MAASLTDLPSQLKTVIKHFSTGKLIAFGVLIIGTVLAFVLLISWSSNPEFFPIYANLAPEDAGEIITYLKENKIPYKLSSNGGAIQIPQEKIYETRIELASKGLPRGSGIGFEVFDNAKLGMTEFVQNVNYQRALQGELSRTITGLSEVENCRVHIVTPPKSLFIDEEEPASASISLKLHKGRWLTKDQIQGIVHLVSSSVSRLKPENVTIVDNNGKLLAGFNDNNSASRVTSDQLEFQEKREKSIENRVKSMLETVLGQDKAIVRVSCELDFVQQEKTEEMYYPENQVVRSEQQSSEYSKDPGTNPEGIPGLASNIVKDKSKSVSTATNSSFQKQDQTRNYEIGKMTSRQIMPTGKLKQLSVAVIVDGTYESQTVGEGKDAKLEQRYIPRSQEEMLKLENIVKSAVSYDASRGDKIEVANISFAANDLKEPQEDANKVNSFLKEYASFIKYSASGLFILLSFFIVVRPLMRWITSDSIEDFQMFEQLPRTISELEKEYSKDGKNLPLVGQAARLINSEQENSMKLIQEWIKEQ